MVRMNVYGFFFYYFGHKAIPQRLWDAIYLYEIGLGSGLELAFSHLRRIAVAWQRKLYEWLLAPSISRSSQPAQAARIELTRYFR